MGLDKFSPIVGGKFVPATLNNKETFLLQFWISKVHFPFTGILLPLHALRVDVDWFCYSWFCLQSFNLLFWNYIDLSTRVNFVGNVCPVGVECDWTLGVWVLGNCVDLLVVATLFEISKMVHMKKFSSAVVAVVCFAYLDNLKICYYTCKRWQSVLFYDRYCRFDEMKGKLLSCQF